MMKYLTEEQLLDLLQLGKTVETFVGKDDVNGHRTLQWLGIEKGREKREYYYVVLHHVFDDRQDGVESTYDFSYVEPDDLHGKVLLESESFSNAIQYVKAKFSLSLSRFVSEGFLDELINELRI